MAQICTILFISTCGEKGVACYAVGMYIHGIDFSFERNVKRISPFLGVILVSAFALFVFVVLRNAMNDLTHAVRTETPSSVDGTIRLVTPGPYQYGDVVQFRSTIQGAAKNATTYITTACFQEERMVYQRSAQQGVSFVLTDQYERDLEWDGTSASCSATLMYRTAEAEKIDMYIVDGVSFVVEGE